MIPIYTVVPHPYAGGWWVLRGNRPENWFPDCSRALVEARYRNAAALLRIQIEKANHER